MKFSTRTTYGLRAMIHLAKNNGGKSLSLAQISQAQGISQKYLEKLFICLKKSNLVKSEKGVGGGYKLNNKPSRIRIYDIILALEGEINLFHCLVDKQKVTCVKNCQCGANKIMSKLQLGINQTLINTKLNQLL